MNEERHSEEERIKNRYATENVIKRQNERKKDMTNVVKKKLCYVLKTRRANER